jgi:hypothetical protein
MRTTVRDDDERCGGLLIDGHRPDWLVFSFRAWA